MWIDILIIAAAAAAAYFAVRYLGRPRRRGCSRDCTKCGQCRQGVWSEENNRRDAE